MNRYLFELVWLYAVIFDCRFSHLILDFQLFLLFKILIAKTQVCWVSLFWLSLLLTYSKRQLRSLSTVEILASSTSLIPNSRVSLPHWNGTTIFFLETGPGFWALVLRRLDKRTNARNVSFIYLRWKLHPCQRAWYQILSTSKSAKYISWCLWTTSLIYLKQTVLVLDIAAQ